MKILILPDISPKQNSFLLTKEIVRLLTLSNHECIVSAPKEYRFMCASINAPKPKNRFLSDTGKCYEEWLYNTGRISLKYLHKDIALLSSWISSERPDYILDLGRISASIVARMHHIPFYSFVQSSYYREKEFSKEILAPLNTVLRENQLEQILHVYDLYQYATKRIAFSHHIVESFPDHIQVDRYVVPLPEEVALTAPNVSIFFTSIDISSKKLTKLVKDAFMNAPFAVNAYIPNITTEQIENINFMSRAELGTLARTDVVIHDGDAYLYHACISLSIPQVIINTGEPEQVYESAVTKRCGFGTTINQYELNVATIYEAYRRVYAGIGYKERAELAKINANKLSPLDLFD